MTRLWLIVSLAVASCTTAGDFCDVVTAPLSFRPEVSALMVERNRPEAVRIDAQNRYGEAHCGWPPPVDHSQ